jgi:hypothetical protein
LTAGRRRRARLVAARPTARFEALALAVLLAIAPCLEVTITSAHDALNALAGMLSMREAPERAIVLAR